MKVRYHGDINYFVSTHKELQRVDRNVLYRIRTKVNAEILNNIDRIVEEKKNALNIFENQTKRDISNDINSRYAPEIEADDKALEQTREEKHTVDSELSELTVKISKNYESYLGKEVLSVNVIDSMIEIMNNGNAETIADALDYYKKTVDKGLQTL